MAINVSSGEKILAAINPSRSNEPPPGLFAGLTGDDLARAQAQYALQKQQELVAFISNSTKKLNDIAMATINNMR